MRKLYSSKSGFTFVEALITFSVVGIFLALTWATVSFLLMKSNEQIVRTRAHFLAVEGMERVKQIRQTAVNRDREFGFYSAIGSRNGEYVLGENGDAFYLESGSNEVIEMEEEPYTSYCRTVEIAGASPLIKQILVAVRWGDPLDCANGEEMLAYSTYLADLAQ